MTLGFILEIDAKRRQSINLEETFFRPVLVARPVGGDDRRVTPSESGAAVWEVCFASVSGPAAGCA